MPTPTDPIAKLEADVEFWRKSYEAQEIENKKLTARLNQQADSDKKLEEARDDHAAAMDDYTTAVTLLRRLADHAAGRDGMLQPSKIFCSKCEDAGNCMIREVYEFLGE